MKNLLIIIVASILTIACGAAKREAREVERKRKQTQKLEQLEQDKKQFEQRNNKELGK